MNFQVHATQLFRVNSTYILFSYSHIHGELGKNVSYTSASLDSEKNSVDIRLTEETLTSVAIRMVLTYVSGNSDGFMINTDYNRIKDYEIAFE